MEKYNLNGKSMYINMTNCPQKLLSDPGWGAIFSPPP